MIAGAIFLTCDDVPDVGYQYGVVLRVTPNDCQPRNNIRSVRVVDSNRLLFYDGQEFKRNECRGNGWLTLSLHVNYSLCRGLIVANNLSQQYRDAVLRISNGEYYDKVSTAIRQHVIDGSPNLYHYFAEDNDRDKEGHGGIRPAAEPQTKPRVIDWLSGKDEPPNRLRSS